MGGQVATIIVEPRFLVREALVSLMETLSYRVVCSVGAVADVASSSVDDGYKLVLVGALSAEAAASEATSIRELWPDSKIMLLLESTSSADIRAVLASQIDGCLPLYVTADTLKSALDLIIVQDLRVMVLGGTGAKLMQRTPDEEHDLANRSDLPGSTPLQANGVALPTSFFGHEVANGASSYRKATLSERESQILDGLVKGHANKIIARTCHISEATVKVHMKSILRKIRVSNRTQAAIWALEHGFCADEPRSRLVEPGSIRHEGNGAI